MQLDLGNIRVHLKVERGSEGLIPAGIRRVKLLDSRRREGGLPEIHDRFLIQGIPAEIYLSDEVAILRIGGRGAEEEPTSSKCVVGAYVLGEGKGAEPGKMDLFRFFELREDSGRKEWKERRIPKPKFGGIDWRDLERGLVLSYGGKYANRYRIAFRHFTGTEVYCCGRVVARIESSKDFPRDIVGVGVLRKEEAGGKNPDSPPRNGPIVLAVHDIREGKIVILRGKGDFSPDRLFRDFDRIGEFDLRDSGFHQVLFGKEGDQAVFVVWDGGAVESRVIWVSIGARASFSTHRKETGFEQGPEEESQVTGGASPPIFPYTQIWYLYNPCANPNVNCPCGNSGDTSEQYYTSDPLEKDPDCQGVALYPTCSYRDYKEYPEVKTYTFQVLPGGVSCSGRYFETVSASITNYEIDYPFKYAGQTPPPECVDFDYCKTQAYGRVVGDGEIEGWEDYSAFKREIQGKVIVAADIDERSGQIEVVEEVLDGFEQLRTSSHDYGESLHKIRLDTEYFQNTSSMTFCGDPLANFEKDEAIHSVWERNRVAMEMREEFGMRIFGEKLGLDGLAWKRELDVKSGKFKVSCKPAHVIGYNSNLTVLTPPDDEIRGSAKVCLALQVLQLDIRVGYALILEATLEYSGEYEYDSILKVYVGKDPGKVKVNVFELYQGQKTGVDSWETEAIDWFYAKRSNYPGEFGPERKMINNYEKTQNPATLLGRNGIILGGYTINGEFSPFVRVYENGARRREVETDLEDSIDWEEGVDVGLISIRRKEG